MRRLLFAVLVAAFVAPTAMGEQAHAQGTGCSGLMPEVAWDHLLPSGPIIVYAAEISLDLAERFRDDLAGTAAIIQRDIGGLQGVQVCLFADRLPLDAEALGWPAGQQLRAASFVEERVVVLSTLQIGDVRPAGAIGLAHQAQWHSSGGTYPLAFGSAVAQWYRSADAGRLDRDHAIMRYARITRAVAGPIPWDAGTLEIVMLWNPQFQDSPIGDFVEFAVAAVGRDILADPDPETLARLDTDWQQQLLNEARGSEEPTSDWVLGAAVVASAVLLAVVLALVGWRSSRRARRPAAPLQHQ